MLALADLEGEAWLMQTSILKTVGAFLVAVAVTYILGSIASTQAILQNVIELDVPVGWLDRIGATWHDLLGMAPTYLPIIAVGFLIAFLVTALIVRFLPDLRRIGYVLAGTIAVLAVHLVLQALLDIHSLPVTRTLTGLLLQGAAGAVGGYVFVRITRQPGFSD